MGAVPVRLDSFRLLYVRLLEFTSVDYWILFRYGSCRRDSFRLLYTLLTTMSGDKQQKSHPRNRSGLWYTTNSVLLLAMKVQNPQTDGDRQTDTHTHKPSTVTLAVHARRGLITTPTHRTLSVTRVCCTLHTYTLESHPTTLLSSAQLQ